MKQELSLSTRLTIAIVALVIFTAGTVGFLGYRSTVAVAGQRTLARLDSHARALAADLANIVNNARADVRGFRYGVGLLDIIDQMSNSAPEVRSLAQWRERVAKRYKAELEAKPDYAQFHVIRIADGGLELIRVQRDDNGVVRIVPDAELTRKFDREYFEQALAAGDGGSVVSTIDLNSDQGASSAPRRPAVQLAAPLFTRDGVPFGVLVVSIDLRQVFKRFSDVGSPGTGIYVVDERGVYLMQPDRIRPSTKALRIQDDFPTLAGSIGTGTPQPEVIIDRDGKRFFFGLAAAQFRDGPRLSVVEAIPENRVIGDPAAALRDSSLIGGAIAVLGAVLLAVLFARSLIRPLTQMTAAVAGFSQDAPLRLPLETGGEIGMLARAFKKMAHEVREKTAAIQHDKEVFENIMATMAEAVVLVDMNRAVVYENAAATTILKSPIDGERPAWTKAFEVFYPDGVTPLPPEQWPSRRSLRGETINECELLFRARGADNLKHLLCGARPIRDATGAQTGAVVVFRDVTEAKETERQLHQSQKLDAIGQLTGGVAHDFNNMLTVITGTSEILVEELADRPNLLMLASMIVEAADRGAELTKHLLAFARKQPLQPRNVDVNGMVINVAQLLRPTLGEHIEIESALENDVQLALIDPSQLSAALLNLAVNARDAMPDGGRLLLETGNVILDESYALQNTGVQPGPYIMIAVSDTGAGIPLELRDKVFEPFFTTKEVGKGTGLGLSMVYGFVKQSNGHIKIYSEEGHGTTIKLYLPPANTTSETSPAAMPIEGGGETIFVVEDDLLVRNFVVAQLQSLGYQTLTASSGLAALATVNNGTAFDLLFTDVIMPGGMNGRQLADEVRQRRPGLKVLYTSGYTENAIVHHGRLDANVLLLPKPYRKSELARMVRLALTADLPAGADTSNTQASVGAGEPTNSRDLSPSA